MCFPTFSVGFTPFTPKIWSILILQLTCISFISVKQTESEGSNMCLKTPVSARLPDCAQSQETDDVITLVLSTVIGRKDNNDAIMCVFLPSGLSTVKGAGLLPHIHTNMCCCPFKGEYSHGKDYLRQHTHPSMLAVVYQGKWSPPLLQSSSVPVPPCKPPVDISGLSTLPTQGAGGTHTHTNQTPPTEWHWIGQLPRRLGPTALWVMQCRPPSKPVVLKRQDVRQDVQIK